MWSRLHYWGPDTFPPQRPLGESRQRQQTPRPQTDSNRFRCDKINWGFHLKCYSKRFFPLLHGNPLCLCLSLFRCDESAHVVSGGGSRAVPPLDDSWKVKIHGCITDMGFYLGFTHHCLQFYNNFLIKITLSQKLNMSTNKQSVLSISMTEQKLRIHCSLFYMFSLIKWVKIILIIIKVLLLLMAFWRQISTPL